MIKRLMLCLVVAGALVAGAPLAPVVPAAAAQSSDETAQNTEDILILSSGATVRGQILEETPDSIRMLVKVGSLEAETTYSRTEIMEIKRDQPTSGAPVRDRDQRSGRDAPEQGDEPTWDANDETTRIYYAQITGLIPGDFSKESLEAIFDDVDDTFGDVTTTYIGSDPVERVLPEARDKNIVVLRLNLDTSRGSAFRGMYTTKQIADLIGDEIDQKGRRVVFWVESALQGGVFVPLTGPDVYFTSNGVLGGIGSLDEFKTGDDMVDEKLIGAMLGQAEGFVIQAGYGENGANIVKAMARPQYTFAVNTSGGRGETMLRAPRPQDGPNWRVIATPGVALNLNADLAQKLNISKGTVDSIDDLAFALGIDRNYKVIDDHRADRILERWSDEWMTAIERINRRNGELWIELAELEEERGQAEDVREWNRIRGRMIRKLREIRSVINRYENYFDPGGTWRADIDVQIEILKQQAPR